MKAIKVYETLGFQRGQSPKQSLNIGLRVRITSWLDEMNIKNYTINDDFTIDVDGNVNLDGKLEGNLPSFIKFGKVKGGFDCDECHLTSLEGAPQSAGENFTCYNNNLVSLEGAPESVGGFFSCSYNNLTSLEGTPRSVGGYFYCNNNNLISLEGAPESVGGYFSCEDNKVEFTEEDVKKVCNVKGEIYV